MAIDGRRTFVPVSDDATVLEFIPPNKMRFLSAKMNSRTKFSIHVVGRARRQILWSWYIT